MAFITDTARNLSGLSRFPTLSAMISVARQRHALKRLDDAALDDLGLSRKEVLEEANRPFWDVPAHWVK